MTAWYPWGIYCVSFSIHLQKLTKPLDSAAARSGYVSVKTWRNASQRGHSAIFPFFLGVIMANLTSVRMSRSVGKWYAVHSGEKCPSCGTVQEMALSRLFLFSLTFVFDVVYCKEGASSSPRYLHTDIIILYVPSPSRLFLVFYAVYDHRLGSAFPIQMEGNE